MVKNTGIIPNGLTNVKNDVKHNKIYVQKLPKKHYWREIEAKREELELAREFAL
jgi:hypothetical protein